MRKAEREAIAALQAAVDAAYEAGWGMHNHETEWPLAQVHREANQRYGVRRWAEVSAFAEGFQAARRLREDFIREQRSEQK